MSLKVFKSLNSFLFAGHASPVKYTCTIGAIVRTLESPICSRFGYLSRASVFVNRCGPHHLVVWISGSIGGYKTFAMATPSGLVVIIPSSFHTVRYALFIETDPITVTPKRICQGISIQFGDFK